MAKRHDAAMNPKTNALSTALTSFGFMFHLGLSPASAMVNLTQTALVAYPVMGARWGFNKASAALLKASQEAVRGKNDITASLSQDEKAAFEEAVRSGVVDVTMAHDLAGIAQGEDRSVSYKLRPVMRAASFLFHHAEKFNRQVTFVAAYRLAREAGADPKNAYQQAVQATYDGHFDYSANNRPRVMQGNVARVLLLFKQYGQNMVYTLARSAQQSLKGATPEERTQARKALAGLLTMHAMAAGVLGLPMVTTLLSAASMLGGDDNEPWDAQVALQNLLADTFGQEMEQVLDQPSPQEVLHHRRRVQHVGPTYPACQQPLRRQQHLIGIGQPVVARHGADHQGRIGNGSGNKGIEGREQIVRHGGLQ